MGYLLTQLSRIGNTAISAVGLHLTLSMGGIMFLGFPVAIALGAYSVAIIPRLGVNIWLTIFLSLVSCALLGWFYAELYRRLSAMSFKVITLASILAFDAVVRSWDGLTGGVLGIPGVIRPPFIHNLLDVAVIGLILGVVALCGEWVILRTPYGRALRGIKENKVLVSASGISPESVGMRVIGATCILGGIAGMLFAWRIRYVDPSFSGIPFLIELLTVVILVQKPSTRGLAGAIIFVEILPELLRFFAIPAVVLGQARLLIYSLALIILMKTIHSPHAEKRMI